MKLYLTIFILLITMSGNVKAQNDLHFSHLGKENGFPLDKANAITQDRYGFIWVGTWNGLSKFDGYTCTNFLPLYHDSTSISNREITYLFTDSNGDVWAGTSNGLNFIDAKTNQITKFPFPNRILSIIEDANSNLWIGTLDSGLYQLDRKSGELKSYLNEETVNAIHEDEYENLWIATNNGLFLLDKDNNKHTKYMHRPFSDALSSSTIMDVVSSKNGYLWIATWGGGLNRADLDKYGTLRNFISYTPNRSTNSIKSDVIFRLNHDKFNNLWIGTWSHGLSLLTAHEQGKSADGATFKNYINDPLNQNSISSDNISSLFIDKDNTLWIGSGKIDRTQIAEAGINRYVIEIPNETNTQRIKCFYNYKNKLWVGVNQYIHEYTKINGKYQFTKQISPGQQALRNRLHTTCNILNLCANDNGLWVGTEGAGLIFYPFFAGNETNVWVSQVFNTQSGISLPDNRVTEIISSKTNKNDLWIGTLSRGLIKITSNQRGITDIKTFATNNICSNSIRELFEDSKGNLWIGTLNGLSYMNTSSNRFSNFSYAVDNKNSINDNVINNIFEDSEQNIWVSTNSGLNKITLQNDSFNISGFPEQQTLNNELLFDIFEDKQRNLWVRTCNGMLLFNLDSENITRKIFNQDFENTRLERNATLTINDSTFVVGNNSSFIIFKPQLIAQQEKNPQPTITNIKIYDQNIGNIPEDKLNLSYRDQMISIHFSNLSFSNPEQVSYTYKLDGLDRQWNKTTGNNIATYANVPPGEYTFYVSSNDSLNYETASKLVISVSPPWWKTNFAYFIYFLIIAGITYLAIKYYKKQSIEKRQLAVEKMKADELERLNEQKSLFFTDITHELRTPLTLILEPAKELSSSFQLKSNDKEKARLIKTSAEKLLRLVNKLMEFRKLEDNNSQQLNYVLVDLNQMMQEIFTYFKPLAHSRNINFTINNSNSKLLVPLDVDKFEKVMFNIISNAFKYTHNGGEIEVSMSESNNKASVTVKDNGIGIAMEYQEKIFERFFQINQIQTQSTGGVGLFMVKELINLHQGDISLESSPNNGSSFCVSLPLKPENRENIVDELTKYQLLENQSMIYHEEKTNVPTENKQAKMLKILIVEDDIDLNKFICSELSINFEVKASYNGKQALELIPEFMPDLVISDVLMPEMGGFELAKTMTKTKELAHIPLIFLTAKDNVDDEIKGLKLGAMDYIHKPFDVSSLIIKIQNILSSRQKEKTEIRTKQLLTPETIKLPSADEEFLKKAVAAVQKNIENTAYDVDLFSQDMNMSQNQLYRRLKALTKQTAKEFIRTQRLKVAADLLLNQKKNASEVVYLVGFASLSYFSRCFKAEYGCAPTDYVKNNS